MTEPTEWPHMLPCPFCGGDARHDAHADDCYFILHRKFKNSGADMSPAFEVLAAWNRRTPQPTQAQAGAVPLTDEMASKAGRALSDLYATECGIDKDDNWKVYGSDFIETAKLVLEAAHGIKGGQHGADT